MINRYLLSLNYAARRIICRLRNLSGKTKEILKEKDKSEGELSFWNRKNHLFHSQIIQGRIQVVYVVSLHEIFYRESIVISSSEEKPWKCVFTVLLTRSHTRESVPLALEFSCFIFDRFVERFMLRATSTVEALKLLKLCHSYWNKSFYPFRSNKNILKQFHRNYQQRIFLQF